MEEVKVPGVLECSDFKPYFMRPNFCCNCFSRAGEHKKAAIKWSINFEKASTFIDKQEDLATPVVQQSQGLGDVYISGYGPPLVDSYLKKVDVKAILNVAGKSVRQIFRPCYAGIAASIRRELGIDYLELDWEDKMAFKLTHEALEEAVKFIEKGRKKGSVLVHCIQGKSRSSAALCAYIMAKERLDMLDAIEKLQKCRPLVDPNPNFRLTLKKYEKSESLLQLREYMI